MINKNKKAFTIIELIVVMAIIGILVLLAVPKFMGHTKQAKYTKLISNTKQLENASERYYMDKNDWPRLTDVPYTSAQITAFAQKVYDTTGKEVTLDTSGSYYDIDYSKINQYIQIPDDKMDYIIQNPVGNVYALESLTPSAETRTTDIRATSITLDKGTASVNASSTIQLIATVFPTTASNKIVTWNSSNTLVATVNSTGLVSGTTVGNAIITATTQDGSFVANCSISVQPLFISATFTNAGAIGRLGPTQSNLDNSYVGTAIEGKVTSLNGTQIFVVPSTGSYKISASGAESGAIGTTISGKGANIQGTIALTKGTILNIVVGQMGSSLGGAGGGTFVFVQDSISPLIVAGGGGGIGKLTYSGIPYQGNGIAASLTTAGSNSRGNASSGGINGGTGNGTGAGAGWLQDSQNLAGKRGGNGQASGAEYGGFGGGGCNYYGGGGGGYSGGGPGYDTYMIGGGGGGSFNSGTNKSNTIGNTGNGKVTITFVG